MTWTRVVATGRGSTAYRLELERLPVSFVTRADMVDASDSAGRSRVNGLSIDGVKLSQKADLPRATIEASGATFKIADIGQAATAAFNTAPSNITWLAADLSASDTSMTVKSTAGWPSSGILYVDSEAIAYASITDATTFDITGGRGKFGTLAQAHYVPDGAFLRYPEVTDRPTTLEGCRARLYAYGAGDDPQGDGTQIWLGIVSTEPRMVGPAWSISVDPVSRILDSDLGADLGESVQPRGIYIHGGWVLYFGRTAGAGGPTTIPVTDRSYGSVSMAGFWATQQDFLDALNIAIAAELAASDTKVYARASSDGTYHFEIQTGANADAINIVGGMPPNEPVFESGSIQSGTEGYDLTGSSLRVTVLANTTYYCFPNPSRAEMPGAGMVPRGVFDSTGRASPIADEAAASAAFPLNRIYLGGAVAVPSNTTIVLISWRDGAEPLDRPYKQPTVDAAARYIEPLRDFTGYMLTDLHYWTPSNLPTIRLGRRYNTTPGTGTFDLVNTLSAAAPTQVNTGAVPLLRTDDYNSTEWGRAYTDPTTGAALSPLASQRGYTSLQSVKLADLICPDLQLAGLYLAFDTSGALTVKRLRLASPTEVATFEITSANLITSDGLPPYERSAIGIFNTFQVTEGYDPVEDKSNGPTIRIRDVASYGRAPSARTIAIEPKSTFLGGTLRPEDVVAAAANVLSVYGNPYAYTTVKVPLTAFAVVIGSTVSITTKHLPSDAGIRGVTDVVGLVTARELDLGGGKIELTVLLSTRRIAGYAPSALVTGQTNTSGNTWAITLSSTYFASGDSAENHMLAGDRVEIYRFDSLTAGTVAGTVVSASGNVVTVTFDGVWNPTATADQEWVLTHALTFSGFDTENQSRYAILADPVGRVNLDPIASTSAFTFA